MHGSIIAIRLVECEFPDGVEGVHFKFVVVMIGAIGAQEDFKIVVLKNHFVLFGDRTPDVRLFQFGENVKVLIIPEHLGMRAKARGRFTIPFDICKIRSPGDGRPNRFVSDTINCDRTCGFTADVGTWNDRFHLRPITV